MSVVCLPDTSYLSVEELVYLLDVKLEAEPVRNEIDRLQELARQVLDGSEGDA